LSFSSRNSIGSPRKSSISNFYKALVPYFFFFFFLFFFDLYTKILVCLFDSIHFLITASIIAWQVTLRIRASASSYLSFASFCCFPYISRFFLNKSRSSCSTGQHSTAATLQKKKKKKKKEKKRKKRERKRRKKKNINK